MIYVGLYYSFEVEMFYFESLNDGKQLFYYNDYSTDDYAYNVFILFSFVFLPG